MNAAEWSLFVPVLLSIGGALAAWLKAQAAKTSANSAHARIDALTPPAKPDAKG